MGMYAFNRLPPNQFALLAAFLGVLLNFALTTEEKAALGNFIISIGQTMLTAQAQEQNQASIRERAWNSHEALNPARRNESSSGKSDKS